MLLCRCLAIELSLPRRLAAVYHFCLKCLHAAAVDGHVNGSELGVERNGDVVDLRTAQVVALKTVYYRSALHGYLSAALLHEWVRLYQTCAHRHAECHHVAFLPCACHCGVGAGGCLDGLLSAVHEYRGSLGTPVRHTEPYPELLLSLQLVNGQRHGAVPRIVGGLRDGDIADAVDAGFEDVVAVEVHVYLVLADGIGIVLCLTEGAQRVRRTAEATDILGALLGPAQLVWQVCRDAHGVGIEIFLSVETDARQYAVV